MNMTLMIQIGLMLCVISIVIMGLVFFIAYDHQLRRRQALQYHLDEKKGNPFPRVTFFLL